MKDENVVTGELRRHFRPEFLNRIDETVVFHPLTIENLVKIVDIQLVRLRSGSRNGASPWPSRRKPYKTWRSVAMTRSTGRGR